MPITRQTSINAQRNILKLHCRNLDPETVSSWCGLGFESHSLSFLLTYPWLIKAYDFLSSLFINEL